MKRFLILLALAGSLLAGDTIPVNPATNYGHMPVLVLQPGEEFVAFCALPNIDGATMGTRTPEWLVVTRRKNQDGTVDYVLRTPNGLPKVVVREAKK